MKMYFIKIANRYNLAYAWLVTTFASVGKAHNSKT